MRVKGIDVSKWQGNIDWQRVASDGVYFAFVRVGNRGLTTGELSEDPCYRKNIEGALAAGIKVGVYFYSTSLNEKEAQEEAEFVLARIKPYSKMPVVFDYEGFGDSGNRNYGMTKEKITANGKVFQDIVKSQGNTCLLYGSRSYLPKKFELDKLDDLLWVARYASATKVLDDEKYFPSVPGYNDRIAIWQCADCGKVDGISGNVDIDYMYIDVFSKETMEEKEEVVKMIKPVDYKQTDKRWKSVKYAVDGENSTIGSAGCGPTALADVLAAIVSPYIDPLTCASWARHNKHNYKVKNSGTSYAYPVAQGQAYGVNITRLNTSSVYGQPTNAIHQRVLDELKKGNWIIACMGKGNWTSSGHFIVAYGYENGYVYISDPASDKTSRLKNTFQLFSSQVKVYWLVEVPEHIKQNGIAVDGDYSDKEFYREVQLCTGAGVDEIPGPITLSKTVTVSKKKNRQHNVVLPLQKKLKKIGLYHDKLDRIAGNNFDTALKAYQTWMAKPDGEATAKAKTWKKLLGLE